MTEEEKGAVQGSSLEELGQKVDAFEGYMREYREAKRSNKVVKIVVVVAILVVVLVYVILFALDISRVYGRAKRITGDPQFQEKLVGALADEITLMKPRLEAELKASWERVGPKFREELEAVGEEYRAEINAALQEEASALYEGIKDELQPQLNAAAKEITTHITDVELPLLYESLQDALWENLRSTGSRLIIRVQDSAEEEALLLSENLADELSNRFEREFSGLLRYYYDLLEKKFPEITDEAKVSQMAANVQVAFEEAAKDIISERLKYHKEALLDISDTVDKFKVDEKVSDEELWQAVKSSLVELLQIKLATEMIKVEE